MGYYYYDDEYYQLDLDNLLGYNGSSGVNLTLNESLAPCEGTSPCAVEPCPVASQGWDPVFLPVLYAGIFLVGSASNGLVVSVLLRKRSRGRLLSTASDALLLHLAAADLLLACTMPFWATERGRGWVFGRALCKLVGAAYSTALYGSVFLLVAISFERYLSVARALKSRRRAPRVWLVCLAIWGTCLALAVREVIYLRPVPFSGSSQRCAHDFSSAHSPVRMAALGGFYHLAGFLLPVAVMGFCYGSIGCTIARDSGARRRKEWRAVRVSAAVVAAFLACWTPFNAALLAGTVHSLRASRHCLFEQRLDAAYDLTRSLGDLHCCLNPFVYAFVGVRFRRELLRALRDWGVRRPARGWPGGRLHSSVSATEQVDSSASFA